MHPSKHVDIQNASQDVQDQTRDSDFTWRYNFNHIPKKKCFEYFYSKRIRLPSEAFKCS